MLVTILAVIFAVSLFALFWTYFGYPLLMYVRAKIQPKPVTKNDDWRPSVTLLIPAYNEADVIQGKLENSLSLDYPKDKLQILVVDDGSDDGTAEIIRQYAAQGVTLLQQPTRRGKMTGVNTGFQNASGEIVVLSDASPHYEIHALQYLMRAFADPTVGVVVGRLAVWDNEKAVAKPAGLYWKYESALRRWESITGNTVAVHGNMFAIRKNLYRPLANQTINDEFSLAMEVVWQGFRVIYEPEAISYDDASASMGDEFHRRARINAGRYQGLFASRYVRLSNIETVFRFISHKLMRSLAPLFLIGGFVSNLLLVLIGAGEGAAAFLYVLLLLGQVGFYLLAAMGWYAEKQGKRSRLLNIPYFFVSTNFAALVGFWRWLRKTQQVTWQKRAAETRTNESVSHT